MIDARSRRTHHTVIPLPSNPNSISIVSTGLAATAVRRIRPKFMTVSTMFMGFVPVLWSTGTGAEIMQRIAAPMIGSLATSFLVELIVCPMLYQYWRFPKLVNGAQACCQGSSDGPPPRKILQSRLADAWMQPTRAFYALEGGLPEHGFRVVPYSYRGWGVQH
jgi:hypothetical protein